MLIMWAAGLAALAAAPCDLTRAIAARDQAVRSYGAGRLEQAVVEIRSAVDACPTDGRLQFMFGNALYRTVRDRTHP